jgi:predicted RNA-binding Zn-ribbon protein involved in translation (DUF1610 family)
MGGGMGLSIFLLGSCSLLLRGSPFGARICRVWCGNEDMFCARCKSKMKAQRGTHHKQKKWVCPKCGRVRMERVTSAGKLSKDAG